MIKLRVVIIVKCVKAREKSSVVAWEMANLLNNKNYCHLCSSQYRSNVCVQKSENTYFFYIEIVSHLALAEKHKNNNFLLLC